MATNLQSLPPVRSKVLTFDLIFQNELLKELIGIPSLSNYLLPELRVVPLTVNQVLYEHGDQIDYLYFPLDCIVSGLVIMEDGSTIETSMVGRESLLGISAILGSGRSRQWIWVTTSGTALQLKARFLEKVFVNNESALKALLRCYRSLITQVSQRCVCNTRHTVSERLCCWLLMIHDRASSANLKLTQEIIASRVGARRAGITEAACMLQKMNAIAYRRGQLHIQNREVLMSTACECYNTMQIPDQSVLQVQRSNDDHRV